MRNYKHNDEAFTGMRPTSSACTDAVLAISHQIARHAPVPLIDSCHCHFEIQPARRRGPLMNAKLIDDLNERINALLQNTPLADVQKNLKAMLTQSFAKMDLVTREEFDIQTQVLARTREKLTALEARLAALEMHGAAQ